MIRKVVWCLFLSILISGNHCSPTDRDLYVFSSLANAAQTTTDGNPLGDEVQDAETAETNTYSDPYGGTTEFVSEDVALEDSKEDPPGPEDHVIPHSEHENPEEVPTRPKYVAPGTWAKPDPKKNIPLDFVPTKTLAQVRGTHTVKVLPQSEAIASAVSEEEKANAPRLREVVSKKKTNTIYTEEGYEDSAYDHAGHIRDADFHEGYARKLHDQRGSKVRSGAKENSKKRKSKNKNSRQKKPEEFEEFTDDYSDESEPSEKYKAEGSSKKKKHDQVNKIYKDMWKKPDVNAKIVAENEIEKLEVDLKREDEEAEKGSENYGSDTDRDPHRYYKDKEKASRDPSDDHPSETQSDIETNTGFPSFGTKENFYRENYEATTVQFGTPTPGNSDKSEAATSGYENPTTDRYYLPDGSSLREEYEATTFNYGYPTYRQSNIAEAPTTVNYGDIFWNYYRTKPDEPPSLDSYQQEQTTIQQPLLVRESTTLGPFDEQTKPVAVATINGHGPYLLVSENAGTTPNPSQLGSGDFSYYTSPQNGHQNSAFPNSQGINSRNGPSFPGFGDSDGPSSSEYGAWGLDSARYGVHEIPVISPEPPTTKFFDSVAFSSTPTYSVITSPRNRYESLKATLGKDSSVKKNPLSNSAEVTDRSDHNYNHEDFATFKDWPKNNKNPSARGREQFNSRGGLDEDPSPLKPKSHGSKGDSFFGYKPNLGYSKMLSFIKNHQNDMYNGQKSESANSEDFTIMKPPVPRESVFSDFTLNSYPNVADYSSVMQESEAARETDRRKIDSKKIGAKHNGPFQKDIHFKTPTFFGNNPSGVMNRKKLFPAAKLLPPPPNSRDNYGDLSFSNRNNGFSQSSEHASPQSRPSYRNGVQNYSPDPEQLARYLRNRKTPSRHTRSLHETELSERRIADDLIAKEISARFNFTIEDQGSRKYRDGEESQSEKMRVKRNLIPKERQSVTEDLTPLAKEVFSKENDSNVHDGRRLRNKRSHQGLLDASHKIAADVIDKEIDSRFKSKDYEDEEEEEEEEEDEEEKREKQVEVEDPDLDYLDEIQEVNDIENIPTTTIASIDLEKYPFYMNNKVPNSSPLKYIINPKEVPKKTFGGMEFYDSRDKYVQCEEVDPNLEEVLPDEEEPVPNRGPKENLPRLRGLGDKLDCFKAKYFGVNPFDNPLFFEKKINQPTPPTELNPIKLSTRILKLPEENMEYFVPAQSRKPETTPIKRIDNRNQRTKGRNLGETSNLKSSSEPRTRRRNRNRTIIAQESSTQKSTTERRKIPQRSPAQGQQTTTTESPEVISSTPYQKEVYEDVMGTIKNLASLYEMFGAQTVSPLTEGTVASQNAGNLQGAASIRNVKTSNRVPILNGKRGKDFRPSGVTESSFHEEIEGLLPPPEVSTKPKLLPYRTNKVSYNTRARTESPTRGGDKKIIGYFRTVMVHKRSLDEFGGASIDPETNAGNYTVKNKRNTLDSEFQETQANLRTVNSTASSSSTTEIPRRGRRRKTSLTSTTTTTTTVQPTVTSHARTETETPRPSYTGRGRSRNFKDEKTTNRYGLFTTTQRTSAATDGRRNEPRYTEIVRRRGEPTTTTATTPSPQELLESNGTTSTASPDVNGSHARPPVLETGEIYETENSVPRRRKVNVEETEPSSEIYETVASDFEPEHVEEDEEGSEHYEEDDEESTEEPVKKVRKYDVHEDVQEDTTPTPVGFSKPTRTSEFVDLESYLATDPPGFTKAFDHDVGTIAPYLNSDEAEDRKENYRNEESKEEQVAEDDEELPEAARNSSYQEEESSDEDSTKSPRSSESYKDSSSENFDEPGDEKKSSEQEDGDDKRFFRYNVRPDSPFESFEDERYSDLGPRVNKPAFHHPPFEAPKYERYYSVDSNEEEKDKTDESLEKEKYIFPWSHDEEDEKAEAEEGYVDQASDRYEFPWEKRERLAEERAQRRKDRQRLKELKDFSFLHDDDDSYEDDDEKKGSSSQTRGKRVYPWDVYDVPSKPYKDNFSQKDAFDSDETSSEHRPIAKFSSKYSSNKFKIPFAGSEPITTAEPKKIRESVLKFLKEADEKISGPTETYETDTSTKPASLTTKTSESTEKVMSTREPVSSGSKSSKRISNSRIIPENITTAPRNRSRARGTPIRDRTTLRPTIKSTSETVEATKAQTTEAPILTTRRASRLRSGANGNRQQPLYKSHESQIASSTVETTSESTTTSTTEEPVKASTKNPVKYTVRKRGKAKTVAHNAKTDAETSGKDQENVTQRSTQAAISTNRRRTRPTVTARPANTKTVQKNYEKAKKPSRVDTKNLVKEMTYDEYRIPTRSSVNPGDRNIEDSTPTSRTVEHRSRVSKEQIITKTSFPDMDNAYKFSKNKSTAKKMSTFNENYGDEASANRNLKKSYSETPDRGKKSFDEGKGDNENPVINESMEKLTITTQETPEHVYEKKELLDKDGHKGMFVSITPKNPTNGPSALEDDLHLKKAEMEIQEKMKEKRYENLDQTETQNAEFNRDIGSTLPEDSLPGQVHREIPPRSNQLKESKDNYNDDYRNSEANLSTGYEDRRREAQGDDDRDDFEEKSEVAKFVKDPKQRLYYYVDHKK